MKKVLFLSAMILLLMNAMGEKPPIMVESPACLGLNHQCDVWCLGETYTISWKTRDPIQATMTIALLYMGSAPGAEPALYIVTGTANDGSFDWTIPPSVVPGDYFLRVRTDDMTLMGDGPKLKIMAGVPSIMVDTPASKLCLDGSHLLTWMKTCKMQPKITIALRAEGSPPSAEPACVIITGSPNSGYYNMLLNSEKIAPGRYFFRVRTDDMSVIGDSGVFDIGECNPRVKLTTPNGGEKWKKGEKKMISWGKAGWSGSMKIILLRDGHYIGAIAHHVPAGLSNYEWEVGALLFDKKIGPVGKGYRVRVVREYQFIYEGKAILQDESDSDFTIEPDKSIVENIK